MQKLFQMNSRAVLPGGIRSDMPFTFEMTQEQWESSDRSQIIDNALSKIGRTNKQYGGNRTYAVTSEAIPKLDSKTLEKVIKAIRTASSNAGGVIDQLFGQRYPDSRAQNKADGIVKVDGTNYYYRIFNSCGVCDFAECLAEEISG